MSEFKIVRTQDCQDSGMSGFRIPDCEDSEFRIVRFQNCKDSGLSGFALSGLGIQDSGLKIIRIQNSGSSGFRIKKCQDSVLSRL